VSCRVAWSAPPVPGRRQLIEAEAARRARLHPELRPGTDVLCRAADGRLHHKIATTPIIAGADMPVVWVQWPSGRGDAVPWPSEDVRAFDPSQARPLPKEHTHGAAAR
jgi:hypothetical protein